MSKYSELRNYEKSISHSFYVRPPFQVGGSELRNECHGPGGGDLTIERIERIEMLFNLSLYPTCEHLKNTL